MINIHSKNPLSMMKFDTETAKTQYFDVEKRCWRLSCMQGAMEGVKPKIKCQIVADFYGKNVSKGHTYIIHQI